MSSRKAIDTIPRDCVPTPQGMVDTLLLLIDKSTDKHDREWARAEFIKTMKIAYARWYPEREEYRIPGGDTKVLLEKGTNRTELAKHIHIPDLWDVAAWLGNSDGVRDKIYVNKGLEPVLKEWSNQVLECWHLCNALKSHIMGVC